MQRSVVTIPVLVLAVATLARAAEKADADPRGSEIRKAVAMLEKNFNLGDAKSVAACWTPEGEFIGPRGECMVGREKIEKAYQEFMATHQNHKIQLSIVAWRPVTKDVAVVDLHAEMTPVPKSMEREPLSTMVLVKRDGRWLIESFRETLSDTPSHFGHLRNLKWMVGDWEDELPRSAGVSVQSTCDWTANGNFLIRKFTAKDKQGMLLAGTEVIGWDPRLHRIRSWTFDSDGGFGESIWTHDGDRWIVKHNGTLADGSDLSVTHILTHADKDSVTLQSKDRLVNGEKQLDVPKVKINRRSSRNAAKPKPVEPPSQVLPVTRAD